jgi:hypothetical protein
MVSCDFRDLAGLKDGDMVGEGAWRASALQVACGAENRLAVRRLPKHGPAYTFYLFTALAVAVAIATVMGFRIASIPRWF